MPPKKEINENRKKALRTELDGLLKGFNETFETKDNTKTDNIIDQKLEQLSQAQREPAYDFDELDRSFKDKAKNVITTMYDFYSEFGIINENEYVQTKKDLDSMNISNIFFQLKTVKIAIKVIMEEITSGNTHPRMFEAMASLNGQFSDTIKAQANYILFLEDSVKKTNMEVAEKNGDTAAIKQMETGVSRNAEFYITSSPKNLIKEIQEKNPIQASEITDAKPVGEGNINPFNKDILMQENDVILPQEQERPTGYEDIIDMI
jgi:Tfp pilus tip-associated adhesin PilY1